MQRTRLSALLAAAVAGSALYFTVMRPGSAQAPSELLTDAKVSPISVPENDQGVNNGYPTLIRDREGTLWCVWISARQRDADVKRHNRPYEEGDMVVLRAGKEGQWSDPVILSSNFGVNFTPVLAENSDGHIIAIWSSRRDGEDGIWWRRAGKDLSLGSELRVPAAGKLEALPSVTASPDRRLWLAYQSFRNGSSDIVFYRLEGSGWQRMPDIADSRDAEFRPRLAAAPDGSIWCAWDAFSGGKYRVMVRRFDPRTNAWDAAEQAPGDGVLDAYAPDLVVDSAGRVWVVYARNEAQEHLWGLRGPRSGGAPRPTTRLVIRDARGWSYPEAEDGNEPGYVAEGDLPRIDSDADDTIWVIWQKLPGHVDWKVGAAVYRNGRQVASQVFGEDEPVAIDGPPRRADQRASIVADSPGHAIFAYERGRGAFRNRDVHLRGVSLRASPSTPGTSGLQSFSEGSLRQVDRPIRSAPERLAVHSVSGERRQLYFGDLHNHILVDDGHQGLIDHLFAIHRHRFGMDFAATTSHGDSNKLLLSELAHNDLGTEVMNEPGRFVTIPGFEWTQGDFVVPRAGHRHVIYETPGGPLFRPTEGHSDSIREFVDLMSRTNGLIFAHHISRAYAGGTDWSYVNVKVEPAVEICSSWGRFEYYQNPGHIRVQEMKNCSVQDAWRMGWRLGVIGGSDGHNLYGDRIQGLTGVYATELTRSGIVDAIRKRRCYATTGEPIQIDFRVNGHLMGSEIQSTEGPVVEASVEGTADLISVEVVKLAGGRFTAVHTASVNGSRAKIWWRDPEFREHSMYYLRVKQQTEPELAARYKDADPNPFPTEMAWSSPVWVDKK